MKRINIILFALITSTFVRAQSKDGIKISSVELKNGYIIGTYQKTPDLKDYGYQFEAKWNVEVAVYVPKDEKNSTIKSVLINAKGLHKDSMYNVILYTVDTTKNFKIPGELLFSITLKGSEISNISQINIAALNLRIPKNGIFVALRGKVFKCYSTMEVPEKLTVVQIENGPIKNNWMRLEEDKSKNARFGLLMK